MNRTGAAAVFFAGLIMLVFAAGDQENGLTLWGFWIVGGFLAVLGGLGLVAPAKAEQKAGGDDPE